MRLLCKMLSLTGLLVAAVAPVCGSIPAPQVPRVFTPWTSFDISSSWVAGRTYHLIQHIEPSVSGTRPDPPVRAVVASGRCRLAHLSIQLWKPRRSNILLVRYDYTPLDTSQGQRVVIYLLTKGGQVATQITYRSSPQS